MNEVCSPYSKKNINCKKIGCLKFEDFDKIKNLHENLSQKNKFIEENKCQYKSIDLCYLNSLLKKSYLLENEDKAYIEKIYEMYYKPLVPSRWINNCKKENKNECLWLSDKNLSQIMNHYMYVYPNFLFLGVFLIDFYYHESKNLDGNYVFLDKLNFDKLKKDHINCCGMIFNTAKTGEKGEHWVALIFFWHNNQGEINYFDSYGNQKISPIPNYILNYMQMISNCGKKYGIHFVLQSNKIIHQKKDGECGMYCLYFLIYSLNNSFDMIRERIPDEKVSKYRFELWRKK